ncbi:hypothetical protein DYB32_000681 [Aphanomyces invadans]|uniref:Uncharacterized protein n=1 Tax=Aphanomyces invadans TaxID=157072 RepID=A0A418B969_9STRA|nr:hypothetical protein DYB32_000681 [Aphanomyces invadans]
MVNLKGSGGKGGQKKKPGDFKRPKRKVGRKVVQSNVTNASIQSRRINMTEQSMLQDKSGAAVTHRNQTLQDILSKASHYNAHVRRDAMFSLKELIHMHPTTLVANIGVVLERMLQAMVDDEAIVREACVTTWKECFVSLASSKSENVIVPFAQLIQVYFCSGLTHIKPSVRDDVLRHINAVLDVPGFALLFAGALSSEECGRLLENFKDTITTKATTVHVKNSYSLFAEKAKAKQSQLQSSVLKGRFFAVEVVHKLLEAMDRATSIAAANAVTDQIALASCKSLLLVPRQQLVGWSPHREAIKGAQACNDLSWPAKAVSLLSPLLGLWMECHGDNSSKLPPTVLSHLILIVEASTIIIRVSKLQVDDPALKSLSQTFFSDFPRAPADVLSSGDTSSMHVWSALNLAIAQCGCNCLSGSNSTTMDGVLTRFVQSELETLATSDRQIAQGPSLLKGRLQLVTSLLERGDRPELLEAFTTLYMCSVPNSATFRVCSAFALQHLTHVFTATSRGKIEAMSWSMISKWMDRFGLYMLALVDATTHHDIFNSIFRVSMGVLSRMPTDVAASEHIESWANSVVAFFTPSTSPVWFGHLPWASQLEAVALLHHLPKYPPTFLRSLATCCKAQEISVDAKSFIIDIVSGQGSLNKFDRGALLSFYMSALFADGNDALCPQVCRLLNALNFGPTLSSILAPTLSKQSVEANTLALLMAFVVCLKSYASVSAKTSAMDKLPTPEVLKPHLITSLVQVLVDPKLDQFIPHVFEGMRYCNGVFLDVAARLAHDVKTSSMLLRMLREASLRKIVGLYHTDLTDLIDGIPATDEKRQLVNELKLVVVHA